MPKLTASRVERLPTKTKRYVVCDDSLRGFEIRVNTNGSKTAVVRYFFEGRVRRMSRVTRDKVDTGQARGRGAGAR